jgi:hypothetical protein
MFKFSELANSDNQSLGKFRVTTFANPRDLDEALKGRKEYKSGVKTEVNLSVKTCILKHNRYILFLQTVGTYR